MRYMALILALLLAACGRQPFHMTDISGAMPRLSFHLTRASDGAAVSGESYRGKVVLLYFGYTNCPDVCPATLANIAGMLAKLHSNNVQVLFVTVDPHRDTPTALKQYVAAFSPQIEGLRGSGNDLLFGGSVLEPEHHVRSGAIARDRDAVAEILMDRIQERGASRVVPAANASQMALVQAGEDQIGESFLLQTRRMPVTEPFRGRECAHQARRQDEVPQPQCREDRP